MVGSFGPSGTSIDCLFSSSLGLIELLNVFLIEGGALSIQEFISPLEEVFEVAASIKEPHASIPIEVDKGVKLP